MENWKNKLYLGDNPDILREYVPDEFGGNMNDYDIAQICINGHVITSALNKFPQFGKDFCDQCGVSTIKECQYCHSHIQGLYHGGGLSLSPFLPPSFCYNCGKPYPWIEAKLNAAKELSDEISGLSESEREILKKSLDDIVVDTPQTSVSALRFKKLAAKAGVEAANALRNILIDIASETAKKLIWPT